MCDHTTKAEALELLLANVTAPVDALIILKKEEECMECHSTSTDRAKYACPYCSFVACGHCLVVEPFAARTAKCPNCKKSIPWPR